MLLLPDLPFTAGQSLLGRGLCGSFLGPPAVPSVLRRLVWASLSPPGPSLCVAGFVCTCFISTALCEASVLFQPPRPAPARRGSYASPALGYPSPPSVPWGFYGLLSLSPLSPPSGWGHSLEAVHGLRSATCSVFCPLIPYLAQFSKTPQLPVGPACKEAPLCTGMPLVSGRLPCLRAQAPIQKFSVFSLFMSLSSLLPHFRELSLSLWSPEIFCCGLEIAL